MAFENDYAERIRHALYVRAISNLQHGVALPVQLVMSASEMGNLIGSQFLTKIGAAKYNGQTRQQCWDDDAMTEIAEIDVQLAAEGIQTEFSLDALEYTFTLQPLKFNGLQGLESFNRALPTHH